LQPVLQYNCNGHAGWTLASWYGDDVGYTASTSVPVAPGDSILGVIEYASGSWRILGYKGNTQITSLVVSTSSRPMFGRAQNSAQVALEVYSVKDCSYYPSSNTLNWTNLSLKDGTGAVSGTWSTDNPHGQCGAATKCSGSTLCTTTWKA